MWTVQVLVLWQSGAIDTPARLLRLLVLFSSRSSWSATELTDRLEVTPRTLRRDVTRLRDLGYPIESTTGRYGGYALGAGGRLPPLLLDDDEAVAVSVGLRDLSRAADPMLGEAAVAAMTKLLQVMPSALRERVDTLGEVTVRVGRVVPRGPDDERPTDIGILLTLAQACRRQVRLRFDYRTGDDRTGRRHVEPHRLVSLRNRWYLVAFDLDRDDWRTFRVDRVDGPGADRRPQRAPRRPRRGRARRRGRRRAGLRHPGPGALPRAARGRGRRDRPDDRRHRARAARRREHRRGDRRRRRLDRPLPGRAAVPVRGPRLRRRPPRGRLLAHRLLDPLPSV